MTQEEKLARERWREECERIQKITSLRPAETDAEHTQRLRRLRTNYAEFCEYYFPHYLTQYDAEGKPARIVHNAPFHNEAASKIKRTPNLKAVFMWPRGHAKSTHCDVFTPLWLMFQEHTLIHFMVVVSKSEDSAKGLLGDIQAELEFNQRLIADFGAQKSDGDWQDGQFVTKSGIAFMAKGRGQSPRGLRNREARPDYIVIDDLDDDELCRNERRVREMTEWVKSALFGALDVGRGRFIMVGNLISKNSVLQEISETEGVTLSKVKAVDAAGNPVWAEKWTRQEAAEMKAFMGYRLWEKEMMHNPITEGGIFKRDWIKYKKILPLRKYDQLICYTDPSFKSSRKNDYKACRFWGRIGTEYHLIDCWVRQDTVHAMVRWLYDLFERLPENVAVQFYMEANFMQDTLLDEFTAEGKTRGYQLPLLPDKRDKPEKVSRIEAVSPLWERGFIFYNIDKQNDPDFETGIEQTLALEHGSSAHDDAPDADEGAIWKFQRSVRLDAFKPRLGRRHRPKNNW
ncbi:MAG: hypothetical protein IJ604_08840 [Prevotella sp.]|nr:hypothetical protein [Prevotella sp.]